MATLLIELGCEELPAAACADERRDHQEREGVRPGVDEQHCGRRDPRDQQAAEDGPAELGELRRRLHEGGALRDELFVVADHEDMAMIASQLSDDRVLDRIEVLELVDEHRVPTRANLR